MTILEQLKTGMTVDSPSSMHALAKAFAQELPPDAILALRGDLGAGKTTFVGGLAKAWDIQDSVTSPTFNLYSIYQGNRQLVHLDAYRLTNAHEVDDLLLEEFLKSPYCLVIEWPEKVGDFLPDDAWVLSFEVVRDGVRRVVLI